MPYAFIIDQAPSLIAKSLRIIVLNIYSKSYILPQVIPNAMVRHKWQIKYSSVD